MTVFDSEARLSGNVPKGCLLPGGSVGGCNATRCTCTTPRPLLPQHPPQNCGCSFCCCRPGQSTMCCTSTAGAIIGSTLPDVSCSRVADCVTQLWCVPKAFDVRSCVQFVWRFFCGCQFRVVIAERCPPALDTSDFGAPCLCSCPRACPCHRPSLRSVPSLDSGARRCHRFERFGRLCDAARQTAGAMQMDVEALRLRGRQVYEGIGASRDGWRAFAPSLPKSMAPSAN